MRASIEKIPFSADRRRVLDALSPVAFSYEGTLARVRTVSRAVAGGGFIDPSPSTVAGFLDFFSFSFTVARLCPSDA